LTLIDSITHEYDMRPISDGGSREEREREAGCLTGHDVAAIFKISKRTLSRKVAMREVPAPVRLGRGTVRWRRKDIIAYLDSLKPR
jgi:predicted DNA-binding transcriptional regulator AlpA